MRYNKIYHSKSSLPIFPPAFPPSFNWKEIIIKKYYDFKFKLKEKLYPKSIFFTSKNVKNYGKYVKKKNLI